MKMSEMFSTQFLFPPQSTKQGADLKLAVGMTLAGLAAVVAVVVLFGFERAIIAIVLGGFSAVPLITKMALPIAGKEKYQITPIGQHSYTISKISQTIHDFFDLLLINISTNEPICTCGSLEYDIKNRKILGYNGENAVFNIQNNKELFNLMRKVAPFFFDYVSQTVLQERIDAGDNCAIIHFTIVACRTNISIVHQDGVSSRDLREMIKNQGDERNSRWEKDKDRALLMDDALLFVYKKPKRTDLPIIPTLCVEFPEGSIFSDETKAFRQQFEINEDYPLQLIKENEHLFKLPKIDENTAWVFSNNKTLHATPHKNVVEHFYGKRVANALLSPDSWDLSLNYENAPFLRVSMSTFYKEKGHDKKPGNRR